MSTYNGCGCTSEDCRINGCLTQRQRNETGGVRVQAIEQERAEFEAWAWQRGYDLDAVMLLSKPPKFSRYANPATQAAWEAYQAGRAALQSQDRMKDQLNLVISKADKARSERTTEVVTCITKARKDEVRDRSGFATEMADQYGFAFIDDDAEYMVCNTESLTDLMSVLGFRTSEERHNVTIPANTALTDEEIQTLWMNVATFDAHLADVLAISRAVERAAIEAYRKRRGVNSTHTLGEPECNHCGGTGDVSGEYPGIACPACAGAGIAPQPAEPSGAPTLHNNDSGAQNENQDQQEN